MPARGFTNQIGTVQDPTARGLVCTGLPRVAVQAHPHPQAFRAVDVAPQLVDSLWLIFRAE